MIEFDRVSKHYPDAADDVVRDLDLDIAAGEICMLVGPSGCGKTTTMKMINKLIEPSSGRVLVDGRDVATVDTIELRLGIGWVIQDVGLFPHLSVADNVATVPLELGWSRAKIAARVDELLDLVDLDPAVFRTKRPRELSGGQKQRVGIARALAADPRIMLMDEPFGALDPITRARMQDEFLKIQEQIRKTIVFVTHDIEEAIKMGDRIAVLGGGRMVQCGTPREILLHPAGPLVSELIGGRKSLKLLALITCGQLMHPLAPGEAVGDGGPVIAARATAEDALSEMLGTGVRRLMVADAAGAIRGRIDLDDLFAGVDHDRHDR